MISFTSCRKAIDAVLNQRIAVKREARRKEREEREARERLAREEAMKKEKERREAIEKEERKHREEVEKRRKLKQMQSGKYEIPAVCFFFSFMLLHC